MEQALATHHSDAAQPTGMLPKNCDTDVPHTHAD